MDDLGKRLGEALASCADTWGMDVAICEVCSEPVGEDDSHIMAVRVGCEPTYRHDRCVSVPRSGAVTRTEEIPPR